MLKNHRAIAYALMRLALGINFFGHGFFRIYSGVRAFAAHTADNMAKGPLPHSLTLGFAYTIPFVEITLGVLLLLGLATRFALVAGDRDTAIGELQREDAQADEEKGDHHEAVGVLLSSVAGGRQYDFGRRSAGAPKRIIETGWHGRDRGKARGSAGA